MKIDFKRDLKMEKRLLQQSDLAILTNTFFFIDSANYYNKSLPKLAEKLNLLYKLLQKGNTFELAECERSFQSVQIDIFKDLTQIHCNL